MSPADPDSVSWVRFALASVTVLGLMALLGWILKYFSEKGWCVAPKVQNRMKIVASMALDPRRKLVIAKCDDIEYHLLLGPHTDLILCQKPVVPSAGSTDTSPSS
ncbi:MAG: hypothetical protein AB7E52_08010 [Bdellovibrionales bacterium]